MTNQLYCMVTGAPLRAGDNVVGLWLYQHIDDAPIHASDSYSPMGGPIFGTVDHFGSFQANRRPSNSWMLGEFQRAIRMEVLIPPDAGSAPGQGTFFDDLSWWFTNSPREDSCGVRDGRTKYIHRLCPCPITTAVIHRTVWNKMAAAHAPSGQAAMDDLRLVANPMTCTIAEAVAFYLSPRTCLPGSWSEYRLGFLFHPAWAKQAREQPNNPSAASAADESVSDALFDVFTEFASFHSALRSIGQAYHPAFCAVRAADRSLAVAVAEIGWKLTQRAQEEANNDLSPDPEAPLES